MLVIRYIGCLVVKHDDTLYLRHAWKSTLLRNRSYIALRVTCRLRAVRKCQVPSAKCLVHVQLVRDQGCNNGRIWTRKPDVLIVLKSKARLEE
jgi:hypothetical protein